MIANQDIDLLNGSVVNNFRLPTTVETPAYRAEGCVYYFSSSKRLAVATSNSSHGIRTVAYADELTRKEAQINKRPGWVNNTSVGPKLAHHYTGTVGQVSGIVQVSSTAPFENLIATLEMARPPATITQPVVTSQGILRCDLQNTGLLTISSDPLPAGTWVSVHFVYLY